MPATPVERRERAEPASASKRLPWVRAELFAVVFVTGAAVICVEILGTRVIGPVFGVSLFIWSALLSVTLGALAVGYYAGGVLADRSPTPRLVGVVVAAAGAMLCLAPLLSRAVLAVAQGLGPRVGPLASAAVLFGPALLALGMVGPIAVRLATRDLRSTGHGVGGVYAISTAGSLVGTFVSAFALVPAFETEQILLGAGAVLLLVGGASLARHWRKEALLFVLFPLTMRGLIPSRHLPSGLRVLAHSQSLYGLVEVIQDDDRRVRFLRSDHSVIGAQFIADGSSAFAFTHLMESVRLLRPNAASMLQIGLGTGALASALRGWPAVTDVVEIDPAVVQFAGDHFGFRATGSVYEEDARTFLGRDEPRYDIIVHDTFTGGTTPEHLLSKEVFGRVRARLRPDGVLVLNFAGFTQGTQARATWAVAQTLRAAFAEVRAFADGPLDERPDEARNVVFFASDASLAFTLPLVFHPENASCETVLQSFQRWELPVPFPDEFVITDARNPLARLQLPVAEDHFDAMNKLLPREAWLP